MGAKLVPVRPLRRLFSGILTAVYFHHSFFPTRRALCALRSGRTERRMTAGFYPFQLAAVCALHCGRTERRNTSGFYPFQLAAVCALRSGRTERRMTAGFQTFQFAALCAPCVVGARKGAKQQALRGYRYKADARPPGATAFPVRRRRGVCRAAVGVPCRRGVYRAAVGCTVPPWVYRAAVGCTVPPWGVPSSRAEVERAPAQVAPFPLGGA